MIDERSEVAYESSPMPDVPTQTSSIEETTSPSAWRDEDICLTVSDLCLHYGDNEALTNISMQVARQRVTALIGPSGCGKSTLLRCFNRMNDLIDDVRITGKIELNGMEIHDTAVDIAQLRRRVGMVFQRPNPFPKSIYENVAYGLRLQGSMPKSEVDDRVEWALKNSALWEEVSGRLNESALDMSGGQQQRLVIARAIAIQPDVLLLDEPASALDPISTLKIEELVHQLKQDYTILIVTHNMQQAARVSDYTGFLYLGKLVEYDTTNIIFTNPTEKQTEDYITGRYG